MTCGSPVSGPIVPPAREGHRRRFDEADKRRILKEAVQAGVNLSEEARRYGIAARVLFVNSRLMDIDLAALPDNVETLQRWSGRSRSNAPTSLRRRRRSN